MATRASTSLLLSLALASVACAAPVDPGVAREDLFLPPISVTPCTLWVPYDRATIQEAVDAVCDGGTVNVADGTYAGGVRIGAKRVSIVGRGSGRTAIEGGSSAFTFATGGGGALRGMTIRWATRAIVGRRDWTYTPWTGWEMLAPPEPIELTDLYAYGVENAVYGSFSDIAIDASWLLETSRSAVDLADARYVSVANTTIYGAAGDGIVMRHGGYHSTSWLGVMESSIWNNEGRGVRTESVRGLYVASSYVGGNFDANVDVWSCPSFWITDSTIESASPMGDLFGDGVRLWASEGTIVGSYVSWNARVGISMFGCADRPSSLHLASSTLDGNRIAIDVEHADLPATVATSAMVWCDAEGFHLYDDGGNTCNGGVCRAQSANLSPVSR